MQYVQISMYSTAPYWYRCWLVEHQKLLILVYDVKGYGTYWWLMTMYPMGYQHIVLDNSIQGSNHTIHYVEHKGPMLKHYTIIQRFQLLTHQ